MSFRPARTRMLAAGLAALALTLTGCGNEADNKPASDTSAATDQASSEKTTGSAADQQADTPYVALWNEYASVFSSDEDYGLTDTSTVDEVNAALGWDKDSLATVTTFSPTGPGAALCIVSTDGLYLGVAGPDSSEIETVAMGEGADCPPSTRKAAVIAVPSPDYSFFTVTRGKDLLPSGDLIADEKQAATADATSLLNDAATVVESTATYEPGKKATTADIEAVLREHPAFGSVHLAWTDPADNFDLGYDLCVDTTDGTWATWDSAAAKVEETGTSGGCAD